MKRLVKGNWRSYGDCIKVDLNIFTEFGRNRIHNFAFFLQNDQKRPSVIDQIQKTADGGNVTPVQIKLDKLRRFRPGFILLLDAVVYFHFAENFTIIDRG